MPNMNECVIVIDSIFSILYTCYLIIASFTVNADTAQIILFFENTFCCCCIECYFVKAIFVAEKNQE